MTGSVFSGPVLIKPLGVVVPAETIGNALAISVQSKRRYALVEPTTVVSDLYVSTQIVIRFLVTAILPKDILDLRSGANAYNEKVLAATKRRLGIVDPEVTDEDEDEVEEEAPRRRGRRRKVEIAAPVLETPLDPEDNITSKAVSFAAYEVVVNEDNVPIDESKPYKLMANISDKNEETLATKLAQLTSFVNSINGWQAKLASPMRENVEESAGSLLPSLDNDVGEIDRRALEGYESQLKTKIEQFQGKVRDIYKFFDGVVAKANEKDGSVHLQPFNGELKIGENVVTLEEIIKNIKEEVFISVGL